MHAYPEKITTYIAGHRFDELVRIPHPSPKVVFIDCGTRRGENFEWDGVTPDAGVLSRDLKVCTSRPGMPFMTTSIYGAEIHMFEPNTQMWSEERHQIAREVSKNALAVYVHDCAVWHTDELKNFFVGIDEFGDLGSSLCDDKKEKLDRDNPQLVPCISIAKFVKENFTFHNNVILKLDVEGAEYDILPVVLQDQHCMHLINSLFVEWHPAFFAEKHAILYPQFVQVLKHYSYSLGLNYAPWPAAW